MSILCAYQAESFVLKALTLWWLNNSLIRSQNNHLKLNKYVVFYILHSMQK